MLRKFSGAQAPGAGGFHLRLCVTALLMACLTAVPAVGAVDYATDGVDLVTGLTGGIGIALDEVNARLYFVDYNAGTLRRIALVPGCETASPPSCAVDTVATGFIHPEDIAVDPAAGVGYVTTRDDPGTTGKLWRVDLATGAKTLIAFNFGAPQQIALDAAANAAYLVGYDIGRLWRIDLVTGAYSTVVSGLDHPVGVAITADRTRAFVTEQGAANALTEIDLQLGADLGEVTSGLTAPFFLNWVDAAETGLYVPERIPSNRVLLVDRLTGTPVPAVENLPPAPSEMVVAFSTGAAYISTDGKIVRVPLTSLPVGDANMVFLAVGHVVSTDICHGYADSSAPFAFKHAPFGGTIDFFGNLERWAALGATHYRIMASKDGGPAAPISLGWNSRRWDPVEMRYVVVPVAPIPGDDKYEIPVEYRPPAPSAARWWPPYLMLRWPSPDAGNGTYHFSVEIYQETVAGFTDLTWKLPIFDPCTDIVTDPASGNGLVLLVDNTPPDVDLVAVKLALTGEVLAPCSIVSHGCNGYRFVVTAHDANRHMYGYRLRAYWGKNQEPSIASDWYSPGHVDAEGPYLWSGVTNHTTPTAAADADGWQAPADCAYTFYLEGWKRTINGYERIIWRHSHQSLTINNAGVACGSP